MKEREKKLKAEVVQCLERMGHCQSLINELIDKGEPLSSRVIVDASVYYTSLGMRLVELDQEYEDLILSTV